MKENITDNEKKEILEMANEKVYTDQGGLMKNYNLLRVNILGTEYSINYKDFSDDKAFEKYTAYVDYWKKEILVCKVETRKEFAFETNENLVIMIKQTLRHEIIHCFLYESGLSADSYSPDSWATSEEMIDWLALQGIKIYEAWKQAGAV